MKALFKKLMRFTEQKEDFFTECLAATMREDPSLARMFLRRMCGSEMAGVKIRDSSIDIATQVPFPGSCIDMIFKINNTVSIGVENKLWSPEGENQLSKYLKLPLEALGFITGYHCRVSPGVVENPRYLKPGNGRDHFMWQDFYDDVRKCAEEKPYPSLAHSLQGLFEHLGFEPPHAEIGDLLDPDEDVAKRNRRNFAKLWESTRQRLMERGWKSITRGSIAELYVQDGSAERLRWAWLDPMWQRGSLRIRLNFHRGVVPRDIMGLLEASRNSLCPDMEVIVTTARRGKERVEVLEVLVPMRKLFADLSDAESISQRLSDYTLSVFDTVG